MLTLPRSAIRRRVALPRLPGITPRADAIPIPQGKGAGCRRAAETCGEAKDYRTGNQLTS
jgi:hypothetical protein